MLENEEQMEFYGEGLTALLEAMGVGGMMAFKHMFFKGYPAKEYVRPEITPEEHEAFLKEYQRKYPEGRIKPGRKRPRPFDIDTDNAEIVLYMGIFALVNKLGIDGMIEFMNFFSDGKGGYTEGKTPRPEGLVEGIIDRFRDRLASEDSPAVQTPAPAEVI